MPTKEERETERGSEREREGKTRSGGAHSSFALPIPRPSTQAPPFLCCPIQICCNEYFAEDVNRFLDGGCRSSSVFGLPSSHGVFSLAPFPNPPFRIAFPFSAASSSSLCACKAQFVASLLRSFWVLLLFCSALATNPQALRSPRGFIAVCLRTALIFSLGPAKAWWSRFDHRLG